ncbi:MAG: transketolase [bacterium]|nr:transketolase [bacterium]
MWQEEARDLALRIRRRVFEHTIKNNGGYLSQACSSAEILATLYVKAVNLGASIAPAIPPPFAGPPGADNPRSFTGAGYHGEKRPDLDRFFVSPSHYALVVYAALVETGRMDLQGLEMFNQDGSSVEMIGAEHSPGMEVTSGSLGLGLSQAAGVALARKIKQETGRVWVFMSDGELQEGQTWEAFEVMAHYELHNMAVVFDANGQQCDGTMESVLNITPMAEKLRAFGAHVVEVNGHDVEALGTAGDLRPHRGPLVILAATNPCRGMDHLEKRRPRLHYVRFRSEQEAAELEEAVRKQLYR